MLQMLHSIGYVSLWLLVEDPQEPSFKERVEAFARALDTGDDTELRRFQECLRKPAGRIVLRDRAEVEARKLERSADQDAVPGYFRARFEETGGALRLRANQQDFRKRLIEDHSVYKEHLERLKPFYREVAENLIDKPGVHATLRKLLAHESTLPEVYLNDIRAKVRPECRLCRGHGPVGFIHECDLCLGIPHRCSHPKNPVSAAEIDDA